VCLQIFNSQCDNRDSNPLWASVATLITKHAAANHFSRHSDPGHHWTHAVADDHADTRPLHRLSSRSDLISLSIAAVTAILIIVDTVSN
jgi:hypothetical protein